MPISTTVFAFSVACLSALLITPVVRRVAVRLRWRDRPEGAAHKERESARTHAGGMAVLAATGIGLWSIHAAFEGIGGRLEPVLLTVVPGTLLVAGVGLVDDLRGCRPIEKLLVQIAAVSVLVSSQAVLGLSGIVAWTMLPAAAAVIALGLWMVTTTNAVNLVDGIDGLAPGLVALGGFGLVVLAVRAGDLGTAAIAGSFAGAALGFLRSNRYPAKIYLGDSGSMMFGYLVASVGAILIGRDPSLRTLLAVALCAWVPLLDTLLAVLRRVRSRVSPFRADRDHVHHRLVAAGLSIRAAAAILWTIGFVGVAAGLAIAWGAPLLPALGVVVVVTAPLARVVLPLRVTVRLDDPRRERLESDTPSGVVPAPQNRAA
ncbi:MAG TPA: MraY family glycosyltransferase [Candidatus Krumholzibacteria bacterium]|nr:MraY family glycosyltransferase [Candidatus Krumholzibacteria bacterium]